MIRRPPRSTRSEFYSPTISATFGLRLFNREVNPLKNTGNVLVSLRRQFSSVFSPVKIASPIYKPLLQPGCLPCQQSDRTVTKWSMSKGKRKTVKAVVRRFYRLEWGAWIRPIVGRHKKHWKKTQGKKQNLKRHVFTNATQSTMLDKMVNAYWRRRKHYVDDLYEPYHRRDYFPDTVGKPSLF
uniref:Large ribosomal subunit protein bL35m n=1 Tax=Lynceus sp. MCZ IZ 141354 TaxID=1930659 RepID=A0A9N6WRR4_9CRUS|nr:EOG090X0J5E [Lynceus sp. MCZ IZ 141354]